MKLMMSEVAGKFSGADLQPGVVYVDCCGEYMLATDEPSMVNLCDGTRVCEDYYNTTYDVFTPTECKLEVFA